jgi:hypothetical protein
MFISKFKKSVLLAAVSCVFATTSFAANLQTISIKNVLTPEPGGDGQYQVTVTSDTGGFFEFFINVKLGDIETVPVVMFGNSFRVSVIEKDPFSSDNLGSVMVVGPAGSARLKYGLEQVDVIWSVLP